MNERTHEEVTELSGKGEPESAEGLSYYTKGQMFRGDSLLVKVKIREGTPEEVAKHLSETEGGVYSIAPHEGDPDEGEYYLIKD